MKKKIYIWPIFKRLITYSKPYLKLLMLAFFILWISVITEITIPIIIKYFIDYSIIKKSKIYFSITNLIIIFFILQFISCICYYYQSILFNNIILNIIQKIRIEAMDATLNKPLIVFDTKPTGQFLSRITNDTELIKDSYISSITLIFRSISLIITILITMFFLEWKLACILILLFPIIIIIALIYQYYSKSILKRIRLYIEYINNSFNETINGIHIIQQFKQQNKFKLKLKKINKFYFNDRMKNLHLEGCLLRPLISLLFSLVLCSILFMFSFDLFGKINIGIFYVFINYLGRLHEPIIELISQQSILLQAAVAGERIFELIDSPRQTYGSDDELIKNGTIDIYNLNFSYCKSFQILNNICLNISKNNFIALIGPTGSGKSTLSNLITGYYPVDKKKILLDGRPIETLSYRVLRKGISIIHQDPMLINETIYNNISLGRNFSEKKIWNVLKKVQLESFVRSLPNKLFTKIGNYGNFLSIGQKQLISIARAIINIPTILILDETTSSIDYQTEYIINCILQNIRKYVTILVIAHRLSTIIKADNILVLQKGKITEQGTHNELLNIKGYYYNIYKLNKIKNIKKNNMLYN